MKSERTPLRALQKKSTKQKNARAPLIPRSPTQRSLFPQSFVATCFSAAIGLNTLLQTKDLIHWQLHSHILFNCLHALVSNSFFFFFFFLISLAPSSFLLLLLLQPSFILLRWETSVPCSTSAFCLSDSICFLDFSSFSHPSLFFFSLIPPSYAFCVWLRAWRHSHLAELHHFGREISAMMPNIILLFLLTSNMWPFPHRILHTTHTHTQNNPAG